MFDVILDLAAVVLPVFFCAAFGYIWALKKLPFDMPTVTALSSDVGTPCLIIATLSSLTLNPESIGTMAAASALAFACVGVGGWLILSLTKQDIRAYLPSIMFGNFGNMGLPLCLFAFGEIGLGYAVVFFSVGVLLMFPIGMGLASGSISLGKLLKTPALYAVFIGLALMLTGTTLPKPIYNTVSLLGDMTIPLMLFALGISLAGLRVTSLRRVTLLALLRIGGGLLVGLAIAELFALEGVMRGVLIIETSLPVAVFMYLFAARYNHRPEEVASLVLISTLISFLTLPLLILIASAG